MSSKKKEELENENEEQEEDIEEENEEQEEVIEEEQEEIKEKEDIDQRIANIGDESLKIQNIISILSDFKNRREEGKTRNDYMTELKYLCQQYFEYNSDICDLIFNLFSPNEAVKFMEASDSQKILTNRAKT